ncbi:MAG: nuclear transport factor 2 family protein [Rhodocyclaceae bacterium]|jgi:hypothetical protein|nr:nuclear transport factor 2 family protein [Rhodocyclaceae bacterium]
MMSIEENKKLVATFWEHFSKKDYDAAEAMMHDDFTYWIAGDPEKLTCAGLRTKADVMPLIRAIGANVPKGIRVTPTKLTAEENRVAVEAESYGETAAGKVYRNQYHFLMEFLDGKVLSVREYLDTMHVKEVFFD